MTGILIQNTGSFWVASPNKYITFSAPTAHAVVEMLTALHEQGEF